MKSFEIRTYGYNELAQLYFPRATKHAATVMLRRWIVRNKKLIADLEQIGAPLRHQKLLTPRQVKTIVEYLGEPSLI